jgi:hypothetical protein
VCGRLAGRISSSGDLCVVGLRDVSVQNGDLCVVGLRDVSVRMEICV